MTKVSIFIGSLMFVPFAVFVTCIGGAFAWLFSLVPYVGGFLGFFAFLATMGIGLKSFEWSMAFDKSSKGVLLPVLRSGLGRATRINAWQAGLLISIALFTIGFLWQLVF